MLIESSAFQSQHSIPSQYTFDGENLSPPLKFLQVPSKAASLVLIVDDPDAPHGTFDHWIVWNIPPHIIKELKSGARELELAHLSPHPVQGSNGFGKIGYGGPSPPAGKPHHYHFKLYALDTQLTLKEGASKQDVERAMKGHILEQAELVGLYQR